MMHRCSCGLFHSQANTSCFSSMPDEHKPFDELTTDMYYFTSSSSSSVDCTLSLGTPSTRLSNQDDHQDIWQPKSSSTYAPTLQSHKTTSRGGRNDGSSSSINDPIPVRRCANCDTTCTPLWRNGPRGPKSLCNACGIRFKKEEKRAKIGSGSAGASGVMERRQQQSYNSWVCYQSQHSSLEMPFHSQTYESSFKEDNSGDLYLGDHNNNNNTGIPFLSWRLDVTDRPTTTFVHDFTR